MIILFENALAKGQENEIISSLLIKPADILLMTFLLNIIPDYISLLETRYIIGLIRNTKSFIVKFLWLIVDLVATFFIFYIAILLLLIYLLYEQVGIYNIIEFSGGVLDRILQFATNPTSDKGSGTTVIFLWTTFFTSVWVWLYIVSHTITRLVGPLRKSIRFLQYLLPVDTKPLQSVCTVMAVISCLITWVILAPF